MYKLIFAAALLLLLLPFETSAQKNKAKPGIAHEEMPALDWRDLKEFRRKPWNWWSTNMAQSLYFQYDRKRNVELLSLTTREEAYNVSDIGLVIKASDAVKAVLEEIPLLSTSKIESWQVTDLDIPVPERVVKGLGFRMEVFHLEFGPLWGTLRAHNGMHGARLTIKEILGMGKKEGLVTVSAKLATEQRGYPIGGEAVVGIDLLQTVFGGRKFRIETKGKNPWSFAASPRLGYGLAFDFSNVYKLPDDWTLIEEIIEQSIVELTPWDSQLERDLAKIATDIVIKDISVPKSLTSTVFETNLGLTVKKNLPPREIGKALRYRQIGAYATVGKSFYKPQAEGTPKYSVGHAGVGLFWATFF